MKRRLGCAMALSLLAATLLTAGPVQAANITAADWGAMPDGQFAAGVSSAAESDA